jgi:DNA replication factor GINS
MDIEKLWEILYKERSTASLQELPQNLYEGARMYIKKLEEEKKEVDAKDKRRELIEDEIRNARMKVEDIIRRRIGKIVKIASSGIKTVPKEMTEEERSIFEDVRSCVDKGRERIAGLILGENEDKMEMATTTSRGEKNEKGSNEELHIVRILDDVPTFMGVDGRIYKLKKEDVIMLPKTNAEILCSREVAMRFKSPIKKNFNKET